MKMNMREATRYAASYLRLQLMVEPDGAAKQLMQQAVDALSAGVQEADDRETMVGVLASLGQRNDNLLEALKRVDELAQASGRKGNEWRDPVKVICAITDVVGEALSTGGATAHGDGTENVDELHQCKCGAGEYTDTVVVVAPWGSQVAIDRCVLPDIISLWYDHRVPTIESCCGHRKGNGYVAVEARYAEIMQSLGYEPDKACFNVAGVQIRRDLWAWPPRKRGAL